MPLSTRKWCMLKSTTIIDAMTIYNKQEWHQDLNGLTNFSALIELYTLNYLWDENS